ncbi:TonB-dependent receptor [Marinagarivorans algicola]|uniref:TonB-dependent receptor n=1 Tax=Marinagarivorans algicola TaxID=1513270 RepID=UPI0009E83031|nr:TonB-dependent receptor [Marinagarivorans algicola]
MTSKMNHNKATTQQRSAYKTANRSVFKQALLPLAITALSYPGLLHAQEQKAANERFIEEVLVTTERRTQSLQDVAGTVQSFSSSDLDDLAINSDFTNLQNIVPGLQITNQEGKLEVYLRGIGSSDSDFSSDPSVATHYNGVYLSRPRSIGPMFFDVERVEVNKGPQGTLRGRNATGGTINIISSKPKFDDVGGYVQIGSGNFHARTMEGVLNVPLSDEFAMRAAVFSDSHDSYFTNAYGSGVEAPGAADNSAARLSFLWEPNDQFSAYVMADKVKEQGSGYPGAFSGRALSAGYDIEDLDDPFNQYFRSAGRMGNEIEGIASTLSYDFSDAVTLEYNASYRQYSFYNANASREWQLGMVYDGAEGVVGSDAESIYQAYQDEGYRNAGPASAFPDRLNWNDTFYQSEKSSTRTHELRLVGETDRFIWAAGVFLFNESFDYSSQEIGNGYFGYSDWFEPGTISGFQDGLGGENRGDNSSVESKAFFSDGTFNITDNTRIKAGVRFTQDKKTANESNVKYQFNFPAELFEEFGLQVDDSTNPLTTDLVLGSNGFALKGPNERSLNNPSICGELWNRADVDAAQCVNNRVVAADGTVTDSVPNKDNNLDYFLDGIESFGVRDNWDEFLLQNRDQIDVIIRSDFYNEQYITDESGNSVLDLDRSNLTHRLSNTVKESYVDWRIGFEHDIGDNMIYGTLSTGTRSGGINRPIKLSDGEQLAQTWDPEKLTVLEFGSKNTFDIMGNPINLNASLFYYDYKDKVLQSLVTVPNSRRNCGETKTDQCTDSFVFSENSTDATIYGLELDGNVLFDYGFEVTWNASFIESELKNSSVLDTRGGDRVVNVDGNALPNTSKINANLSLSQKREVEWGSIDAYKWTISLSHRSKYYLTPYNNKGYAEDAKGNQISIPLKDMVPNNNPALADTGGQANGLFFSDVVPSYTQVNMSAGISVGESIEIDAFVNNLTEEVYSGKGFINNDVNIRFTNSPRIYGVRFKSSF